MNQLDILIPFALPPPEFGTDLLRQLQAPAFSMLLARGRWEGGSAPAQLSRVLPHENWLADQLGWSEQTRQRGSPPLAQSLMRRMNLPRDPGYWFIINPVHLHVARDHLVLTDLRHLHLAEEEARVLFDIACPLFREAGKTLIWGNAETWFARADDWRNLVTTTPQAATGRNIDIWMPRGEGERDWRKLQNEVQMHWFGHALNEERQARGLLPVNSIWIWGTSTVADKPETTIYSDVFNLCAPWSEIFGSGSSRASDATSVIGRPPGRRLLLLDSLTEPALANDWALWLHQLHALEANWFAPLLAALKSGKLAQIALILSDQERLTHCSVTRASLRKFWLKPQLARLLS